LDRKKPLVLVSSIAQCQLDAMRVLEAAHNRSLCFQATRVNEHVRHQIACDKSSRDEQASPYLQRISFAQAYTHRSLIEPGFMRGLELDRTANGTNLIKDNAWHVRLYLCERKHHGAKRCRWRHHTFGVRQSELTGGAEHPVNETQL
jgi:hypothetical protein